MKKMIQFTMMSALAVAAFGADRYTFTAQRPFEVTNKTLPAGRYQVEKVSGSIPVLKVENQVTGESALFRMPVANNLGKSGEAKVEFRCSGERCRLAALTNLQPGVEIRTAPEKKKAVQIAQNQVTTKGSE